MNLASNCRYPLCFPLRCRNGYVWRLSDVWNSLQQNVIDAAINEWRERLRACVHADAQHFEQLVRSRVTNKSCGQIKYK